jgi:phytanoyl-CoA hydroxylase
VLSKVQSQLRYRRALRTQVAPEQGGVHFSRFGGLWTDRADAGEELERRQAAGSIGDEDAELLRHWMTHGYVILERGVEPEACDRLRADLDRAFAEGDPRLLMHSPAHEEYQPLEAGADTERARVVDVYAFFESARAALFSPAIVQFLRTVFDATPLLFQSLTFEKGSQQALHQDTEFVVTESPLEFAAAWIALEDIRPGSGELAYLDGSHRLPEYLFSGKYKHFNAQRDGAAQEAEWRQLMEQNARQLGMEERTFLPRQGDVLIWSADLVHGGSPVTDPALTRKSLVGHYCPDRVDPFYFKLDPGRRSTRSADGGRYASQHYAIAA